jgi:hypothetical protein
LHGSARNRGNLTNGKSKGNGFADRCVQAYDQLVLGDSNMVVGTLRTGAVISIFVTSQIFYLIR